MENITVICNVEHDITPGVCCFCERDKLTAQLEAKERDRQYHMGAINTLASFLAFSGPSTTVVQAAIDKMTYLVRELQSECKARKQILAFAVLAEIEAMKAENEHGPQRM